MTTALSRNARCTFAVVVFSLVLLNSCVEVTDLRTDPPAPDVPVGQIDTGWTDSSSAPACENAGDCPQGECGTSQCLDGACVTDALKDGQPCSDGDPNTIGDLCVDGVCIPGSDVCVCSGDADCAAFDDDQQCNGRLVCDGCSCVPMDTPPGTVCDDGDPLTAGDQCIDETTCQGEIVCQCNGPTGCTPTPCNEVTCDACLCVQHPADLGHAYREYDFADGVPDDWLANSTSNTIIWRDAVDGLRVGDATGVYDGGAVIADLSSPAVVVPNTTVVLEVDVALFSAEDSCDDRLEIVIDDALVDTLCGPTSLSRRRYDARADELGRTSVLFRFISDNDDNQAAGPFVGPLRWVRARWDTCGLLPAERVVPVSKGVAEYAPAVGVKSDLVRVFWTTPEGIFIRDFDPSMSALNTDLQLDPEGTRPEAAGDFALWERPEDGTMVLFTANLESSEIITPDGTLDGYDLDADFNGPVVTWRTTDSPSPAPHTVYVREGFKGSATVPVTIGPALMPHAPRIALTDSGPDVLLSTADNLSIRRPGRAEPVVLVSASTSQPQIAAGHGGSAVVWTTAEGITIGDGTQSTSLVSTNVTAVDVAPHTDGWYVIWVSRGATDTDIRLGTTGPDLGSLTGVSPPVSEYLFAEQDSPRLMPGPDDTWAVWRSDWYDADSSTVVLRSIP